MITAIHLEHFKSYGTRTTIPIKPLTFLCGPNNGGKSSIIQAIAIAAEILNEGEFDGHTLALDRHSRDFGGMDQLRHQGNRENNPRIGFSMRLDGELPTESYEVPPELRSEVDAVAARIDSAGVWIDVATSEIEVAINGKRMCRFVRPTAGGDGVFIVDMERVADDALPHSLCSAVSRLEDLGQVTANIDGIDGCRIYGEAIVDLANERLRELNKLRAELSDTSANGVDGVSPWEALQRWITTWEGLREAVSTGLSSSRLFSQRRRPDSKQSQKLSEMIDEELYRWDEHLQEAQRVEYEEIETLIETPEVMGNVTRLIALILDAPLEANVPQVAPMILPRDLATPIRIQPGAIRSGGGDTAYTAFFDMSEGRTSMRRLLEAVIDLLSFAPCRHLQKLIGSGVCVGPVRTVAVDAVPEWSQAKWHDGSRGWAEFLCGERRRSDATRFHGSLDVEERQASLQRRVSRYLGPEFLDMGIEMCVLQADEHLVESEPTTRGDVSGLRPARVGRRRTYIRVRPLAGEGAGSRDYLSVANVGAGVSQVLPCLLALQHAGRHVVSLEQPEIHLNPKQAVAFGDVLLHAVLGIAPDTAEAQTQNSYGREMATGEGAVFVETHSDAMMLRVLSRVRRYESARGNASGLHLHQQVGVVYVDQRSLVFGDRPGLISVTRDGRWSSPWPDEFFRVSAKERMR